VKQFEKSAAERGGISRYERKETPMGEQIIISYNNGDKVWKYSCEECYLNYVDAARQKKNGGFKKCLGCHIKELNKQRSK
jgi:hypothetical protein